MQQPELGSRLTALRKEKNLTQEELVEKSHVSVRTIQRIEAGEVLPRLSTVKILLTALGQNPDSFFNQPQQVMENRSNALPGPQKNTLLIAIVAGAMYLVAEIILGAMDLAWFTSQRNWEFWTNAIYIGLTALMITSYAFFARGFIALSNLFENTLLKIASYLMVCAVTGVGILDVSSLGSENLEMMWIPYSAAAVLTGAICIIFGVALLRLQDGMGELSRVAGLLEIVMGCTLVTVVLFFISYVMLVPVVVVEILVLYRGYEYLLKVEAT